MLELLAPRYLLAKANCVAEREWMLVPADIRWRLVRGDEAGAGLAYQELRWLYPDMSQLLSRAMLELIADMRATVDCYQRDGQT